MDSQNHDQPLKVGAVLAPTFIKKEVTGNAVHSTLSNINEISPNLPGNPSLSSYSVVEKYEVNVALDTFCRLSYRLYYQFNTKD